MDAAKMSDEISILKKIRQEKEEQLRILGFDISDLSDETHSLLTTLSQLQAKLGVNTNDPDKLKELYFSKKLENIEYFEAASKMKRDIQELECSLEKEEDDISFLEKFIEDVSSKKLVTDAQKENNRIETQKAIKDVMNKIPNISQSDETKFMNVIAKVEKLKEKK